MTETKTVRVAVTQSEPEWFDLEGSVNKTCALIKEAAKNGAKLVAFPEMWVPGYPAWIWARPVDFDLAIKYVQSSLRLDSPEMTRIRRAAAENEIVVSLGFSERDGDSVYIAQATIDSDGSIKMRRRKFKPTHMERTIFGDASGECLNYGAETTVGSVGSLSCWEHIQPLLKYNAIVQRAQFHVAAWPPLDPFIDGSPGLWSMSIEGCASLAQVYAVESQSFVLHSTSKLSAKGIESMSTKGFPIMGSTLEGASAVYGPDGRRLTEPSTDEIIYADVQMDQIVKNKTFADPTGHYSRPDMLWLGADSREKKLIVNEEARKAQT